MRRILMLIIISVFGLNVFSQDLSIATFNCEFLVDSKVHAKYGFNLYLSKESEDIQERWSNSEYRKEKFEEACELVAQQIKLINADIIGLTEIGDENDFSVLRLKLEEIDAGYAYNEICNSSDPTGQHVAVLSRYPITLIKEKFEGRAYYFIEDDYDEINETGISKGMQVKIDVNGKKIDIFLLHLISERMGYEYDAKRLAQVEVARREIIPLLNYTDSLVVVMGDFNSEKHHKAILKLRGFDDIYPELIQTGDDNYFPDLATRWTYNYMGNYEQIDHILLSHGFVNLCGKNDRRKNKWRITSKIIPTNNERISDHNALKVELFFK